MHFLFLFYFSIVKQNGSIELILANLDSYVTSYSPNKIYLQTDRSTYSLEDTVWFKAYTLDAAYHFPTDKSKVIYVDILNKNGDKVLGKKLYTENLGVASDFFIGREWIPGRYKLRAYTKFMLNQDQEFIYNKEIQIVDINKASDEIFIPNDSINSEKVNSPSPSLELTFFPESGDLLAGIDSRVAIRIENYSADLGDILGSIEDESGNLVVRFRVFERGYGLALFKPVVGKQYLGRLDNDPKLFPLPEVKARGFNIMTLIKSDKVSVTISSNVKSGLSNGDILIQSRGRLIYHKKLDDMVSDFYGLQLNTKEIPTGVTHITFFDKHGIPRSERLFFVDNDLPQTVIKTDKSIYGKREKVDLNLSVINTDLKSFDCSVSVFNNSNLKGDRPSDNIKSWMLLNSDLRGKINDPAFYFEKPRDQKRSYLLDLVMMTHGWRRFTWEDMSQENAFQDLEHARELGLYVKGYTSKLLNTQAPIKSNVILNFLNNDINQEEVFTGDDGRFAFGPFIIEDSITAIIQAQRYKEKNEKNILDGNRKLDINIDAPQYLNLKKPTFEESSEFDFAAYQTFIANNKISQALKDQYNNMEVTLSDVVFTAKRLTKVDELNKISLENSSYKDPSNRIIVEGYNRSVFDYLQNVPGVTVQGVFPYQSVIIRGFISIDGPPTPIFLLDGMPITAEYAALMSPNDILFIDVLKGAKAAVFGIRGANGVIAIYTRKFSDRKVNKREPGIVDIIVKGFDKNREFYSPDYSENVSSVYEPDVRATLYWNPYVLLSNGEENSMSFFTGDNAGNYVVTTEGLSEEGDPIFGTYEFSVK